MGKVEGCGSVVASPAIWTWFYWRQFLVANQSGKKTLRFEILTQVGRAWISNGFSMSGEGF